MTTRQSGSTVDELKPFFEPKSVAVIGASRTPSKAGYLVMKNLFKLRFKGRIYPVNPKADRILGLKVYQRVDLIPESVDTAIICTPATQVLSIVEDCARKRVKAVIILSGGFSEESKEGKRLEQAIVNTAKRVNMRIIGPNTTGILNTENGFTSSWASFKGTEVCRNGVAFVAQTGNFAGVMCEYVLTKKLFGISKVVGMGNKCDVDDADALEYLAQDPCTKVIMMYIEGVKDGRRFFEVAKRVTRKKPVIVLKSGITESGKRVAASHTGSMTGDDRVFDAVCKQAGLVRVREFEELLDLAKALILQPLPKGNQIALVHWSGALCVVSTDLIKQFKDGLKFGNLSKKSLDRLREVTPLWHKLSNPIDLTPSILSVGPDMAYEAAMDVIIEDENIDGGLVSIAAVEGNIPDLKVIKKSPSKPILFNVIGDNFLMDRVTKKLHRNGFPAFHSMPRAIRVLNGMYQVSKSMQRR